MAGEREMALAKAYDSGIGLLKEWYCSRYIFKIIINNNNNQLFNSHIPNQYRIINKQYSKYLSINHFQYRHYPGTIYNAEFRPCKPQT